MFPVFNILASGSISVWFFTHKQNVRVILRCIIRHISIKLLWSVDWTRYREIDGPPQHWRACYSMSLNRYWLTWFFVRIISEISAQNIWYLNKKCLRIDVRQKPIMRIACVPTNDWNSFARATASVRVAETMRRMYVIVRIINAFNNIYWIFHSTRVLLCRATEKSRNGFLVLSKLHSINLSNLSDWKLLLRL